MKVKVGDRVWHKKYGNGTVYKLKQRANFADIDLEKNYETSSGRIKDTMIVLITDLKIIDNEIRY